MQHLLQLEEQGSQALSLSQGFARKFYNDVLRDDAVMVFPGGLILCGKENILADIGGQPWKGFCIQDAQVIALSETAGVVVYKVTAQREAGVPYVALISSTYIEVNETWKLVMHQQTLV